MLGVGFGQKAVRSITKGRTLPDDVVQIVFFCFDADGDGALAHKEFVHVRLQVLSGARFGLRFNSRVQF